jgi:RNA polymerase sigma-70 factor (ECF subfamily)
VGFENDVDAFASQLTAARAGADWAWERIYRSLAPSVIGYLRAQGAAEPEDVAGEVFVQIVRDLPRFTGEEERDFRAWVFTIVHRRLIDERRRRTRRPATPAEPEALERAAGPGGDVAEDALASIGDERVRAVLADLPPDQRAVLLLRLVGDMTIEEIARTVGKRVGATKALQRRALRRVEQAYPFDDVRR